MLKSLYTAAKRGRQKSKEVRWPRKTGEPFPPGCQKGGALSFWFIWSWKIAAVNRLMGNTLRKSRNLAKEKLINCETLGMRRKHEEASLKDTADSGTRPPVATTGSVT